MSNVAKLAYYKADKDVSKLAKRGYKTFEDYKAAGYTIIPFKGDVVKGSFVDGGYAFGNIFIKGNDIVIAYRGTVTGNDWLSNFDALQTKYPDFAENKGIHKGFCEIFQGSRKAIRDALFNHLADNGLSLENLSIQFTGHSLGGALAKIAALEMSSDPVLGKCIKGVATFGDPRAFDFDAAKLYQDKLGEKTVRISQAYDSVPRVATGFMGYSHVGAQIKIPLLQKINGIFKGLPHI
jgi:predicted lipase